MTALEFAWDEHKRQRNRKKHGIDFEEAQSAFYDEHARLIDDPDHSEDEERSILLGMSYRFRLLAVCHALYEDENIIRIISAREATARERRQYMECWR